MARMTSEATRWRWNPRVAWREVDGSAFILLDGRMVSLNEVGSTLWASFEHSATVADAAHEVAEQFEVDAAVALADAEAFVGELVERAMLIAGPSVASEESVG